MLGEILRKKAFKCWRAGCFEIGFIGGEPAHFEPIAGLEMDLQAGNFQNGH
jgi:hypothetical protein